MLMPGILPVGAALMILLAAVSWLLQPPGGAMQWAMQAVPLLIVLPGLLRGARRALQWLGFILLFIMLVSITQAFNALPILRMLGIINLLLALAMFAHVLISMKKSNPAHKES